MLFLISAVKGDGAPKIIGKKERQAELKKVLLETMMLTNVLKE
jgi:hypothetical protein